LSACGFFLLAACLIASPRFPAWRCRLLVHFQILELGINGLLADRPFQMFVHLLIKPAVIL